MKQLGHAIRLGLNSVLSRLKQKYDASLTSTDATIADCIQELEKSLSRLTEMLLQS